MWTTSPVNSEESLLGLTIFLQFIWVQGREKFLWPTQQMDQLMKAFASVLVYD